ncbi:M20/M25/M40 family metallo-hydrolase [Pseudolysinimonas sp.]|uniref:M20/M25/M40 family metallo-hydrolase n=1 Tax=Pseudolysinimonas sp. TaxID=2680009 RepID=UPI003F7ED535
MSDGADPRVERLRAQLRVPTVSRADDSADGASFERYRALLREHYPRVFGGLEVEEVAGGVGLLLRWPGRSPGAAAVLMAHYDTVPADEPGWTHPPFDATMTREGDDRRIWARGSIDDKNAVAGVLEAVEALLAEGFRPEHDVWLSFGGDEEVLGRAAEAASRALQERGVRARLVLDEGGAIVRGQFPGVAEPTAAIGLSEKGIGSVELTVRQHGGHAAHPPRSGVTATTRLAAAITAISRPSRAAIPPVLEAMFEVLGPRARGLVGFAYRHPRLMRPLLLRALARGSDETHAMIRTTRVVSRLQGAAADNVLPETARAIVNVRVAIGERLDDAVDEIRRLVGPDVEVRLVGGSDPSPVSPIDGEGWRLLCAALAASHPEVLPAPYGMLGATDGRHFTPLGPVYRFFPFELTNAELGGLHAIDESIRVSSYLRGLRFYEELLLRL